MITPASIKKFKSAIKGLVTQPGDKDYSITRWSHLAEKKAQFVVYPKDAKDISTAIKFVRDHHLDVAVRGGGHASAGQSSSEGLVIDFSKYMTGARVDIRKKVAYVQGGCKTGTLENETVKYGLAATLGTCSQVGVVGHLIGGGIGISLGLHGLALDNLISATVVLANGDIVKASESEHSDLFWGIRGGGSNFGVITEIAIQLHDQRADIYSCTFIYLPEQLPAVIEQLAKWRSVQQPDEFISMVYARNPQDKQPILALGAYKNDSQASGDAAFQAFAALGPILQLAEQIPFEQFTTLSDPYVSGTSSRLGQSVYISDLTLDIAQAAWEEWLKLISDSPARKSSIVVEFYYYDKMASVSSDATAYFQRRKDLILNINLTYPDRTQCVASEAKAHALRIKSIIDTKAYGSQAPMCGYPLHADPYSSATDSDEYSRALFGSNYPRLQQIKKMYDPNMMFNKWFPIQPAQD